MGQEEDILRTLMTLWTKYFLNFYTIFSIILKLRNSIHFSIYIQKLEIRENGVLLFEGFDGCEYGMISKWVIIPEWFKEKYVTETCIVSNEW